ncbi:MAG: transporter related protein [Rhizobium sp.]|nr:transporter related protein [Rhizobium sp.]
MLTIRHVSKWFANGTQALDNFMLKIASGEIVVLIGASGCGKSTLLWLASGLDRASQGGILIDGERVTRPSSRINLIFQEPRLFPWLKVADNIGFGLEGRDRRGRIERVLAKVGLEGFDARWPKELSGGQAQRVAIARALVIEPKVILLDEPFSALDAFTRRDLQQHLLTLWQESRPTMLMVTHDIDEALIFADRVIVMQPWPGRILEEFTVDLQRDRDPASPEFEALKRRLHASLGRSMAGRRHLAA